MSCQLLKVFSVLIALVLDLSLQASISFSRTLFIDDVPFYIPSESLIGFSNPFSGEILPLTVITTNVSSVTGPLLQNTIESWFEIDDVVNESFLQGVVLVNEGKEEAHLTPSALSFLAGKGTTDIFISKFTKTSFESLLVTNINSIDLPAGPYVLAKESSGKAAIFKPFKLNFDQTQSFFKSIHPLKDGSFSVVSASLDTDSSPYIGVPSKIYSQSTDKDVSPLAGVRVTVKDIYFLKGIKASCGNRAFYATYPARNATGPAVSRLVETGADIVGVTKTVQFANGDRATADWVDYHAPFDIRGDGYREPSGSSTGAGASTAAHDWLDVAIGSDTGGSIRGPAGVNGLYGIRPSVGAISLDEVMPLSDVLDTGGYIARDPRLFRTFGKTWYGQNPNLTSFPSFPRKVLLSSSFSSVNPAARTIYEAFFGQLSNLLGATMQNFSIAAEWNRTSGQSVPVTKLMNETYPTLIAFNQWNVVGAKLFADFAAANDGRNPHINPAVLKRWQFGQSRSQDDFDEQLGNRATFEAWATKNLFGSDNQTCSEAIYVYPQSDGTYDSRELYFDEPSSVPFGFSDGRVAVFARSPDMVVPLGQIPYNSTISGLQEVLPVSVSLVANRNCDFMLLDLLAKLADAGIAQTIKTGRTAF